MWMSSSNSRRDDCGNRIDANWWPLVDANRVEFPSLGLTSCKFLLVRLFHVCSFSHPTSLEVQLFLNHGNI